MRSPGPTATLTNSTTLTGPGWNRTPCLHCSQLPASVWNLLTTSASNTDFCILFTCMLANRTDTLNSFLWFFTATPTPPQLTPHPTSIKPAGEDFGTSGFTVKKANVHEDGAAYTVSTFSLIMEMETVTHVIILADSVGLLQKSETWKGKPRLECVDGQHHLRKLLWVFCPGHAGVKGNDRADRLMGKGTHMSGVLLLEDPKCKELETLFTGTKPRTSHHQSCQPLRFDCSLLWPRVLHYAATLMII